MCFLCSSVFLLCKLQPPDVIAAEIAENLEATLEQAGEIYEDLMLSTTE